MMTTILAVLMWILVGILAILILSFAVALGTYAAIMWTVSYLDVQEVSSSEISQEQVDHYIAFLKESEKFRTLAKVEKMTLEEIQEEYSLFEEISLITQNDSSGMRTRPVVVRYMLPKN